MVEAIPPKLSGTSAPQSPIQQENEQLLGKRKHQRTRKRDRRGSTLRRQVPHPHVQTALREEHDLLALGSRQPQRRDDEPACVEDVLRGLSLERGVDLQHLQYRLAHLGQLYAAARIRAVLPGIEPFRQRQLSCRHSLRNVWQPQQVAVVYFGQTLRKRIVARERVLVERLEPIIVRVDIEALINTAPQGDLRLPVASCTLGSSGDLILNHIPRKLDPLRCGIDVSPNCLKSVAYLGVLYHDSDFLQHTQSIPVYLLDLTSCQKAR